MSELTAWTTIPSVAEVIRAMTWERASYIYLEQVPRTWLTDSARQQGIQLLRYNTELALDTWPKGLLFNAHQELKWEQRQQHFHLVYCGTQPPEGWTLVPLHAVRQHDCWYYLWGRSLKESDKILLGGDVQTPLFMETQIPRLLHYPVATQAQRVQVCIREFYGADGQLCYSRWCGLQETP